SDHHLGASGPQGRRPIVLAADQGANRKPALEEEPGHGSPDCPELTGCPGDEDRPVIGHATSLPFDILTSIRPARPLDLAFPELGAPPLPARPVGRSAGHPG